MRSSRQDYKCMRETMRIDYFIGYCVVTVINILWTGGLYIAITMQLGDLYNTITEEREDDEQPYN